MDDFEGMSDETMAVIGDVLTEWGMVQPNPEPEMKAIPLNDYEALLARIDALETRAIRRLEMVEQAVFSKPAPKPEKVNKADWDAAQEQIKYLVNTIYEIHEAIDTYAYTLPSGVTGGARLIAQMCKKAEDRQLEFEAEQGN
jgi:hypothetical protein